MKEIQSTENWLKSVFNINREIDFERESAQMSLRRIEQLEKQKEEICRVILSISNPTYKQILHKRYIQGKKWEEIEAELNYAEQHVHRLHRKAVEEAHNIRMGRT
jgi:DNA-directed RNA polymerase specialized sigma subunit